MNNQRKEPKTQNLKLKTSPQGGVVVDNDYVSVTEIAGDEVTQGWNGDVHDFMRFSLFLDPDEMSPR